MNQLPERQQVQVEGIGNGCEGRAGRGEDDGAGDGPWNDGGDDDSCVFQVFRKLLLVLIECPQSWDVRMTASVWLQEMRLVMMAESSVAG